LASIEEKQIAKEILIEILKTGNWISRDEYPESKTLIDVVCIVYKEILKTISSNE
jgi:hypothetical protein